jgi:hypothetical protein
MERAQDGANPLEVVLTSSWLILPFFQFSILLNIRANSPQKW